MYTWKHFWLSTHRSDALTTELQETYALNLILSSSTNKLGDFDYKVFDLFAFELAYLQKRIHIASGSKVLKTNKSILKRGKNKRDVTPGSSL